VELCDGGGNSFGIVNSEATDDDYVRRPHGQRCYDK